jgi:hypothetical protein
MLSAWCRVAGISWVRPAAASVRCGTNENEKSLEVKIGFISMPLTGHLNPMIALSRKLQSRGHEIVFIGVPDVGPYACAAGLDFVSYCEEEFPAGSCASALAPVAKLHGTEATTLDNSRGGQSFLPDSIAASAGHTRRNGGLRRWCSTLSTCTSRSSL